MSPTSGHSWRLEEVKPSRKRSSVYTFAVVIMALGFHRGFHGETSVSGGTVNEKEKTMETWCPSKYIAVFINHTLCS
jgi:hypothetical protein